MSDINYKQRCAIRFCFRLGPSAAETFEKLCQVYEGGVLSKAQIFRGFKSFVEGRESIEDELPSGRPSSSRTDKNVGRIRMTGEEYVVRMKTIFF